MATKMPQQDPSGNASSDSMGFRMKRTPSPKKMVNSRNTKPTPLKLAKSVDRSMGRMTKSTLETGLIPTPKTSTFDRQNNPIRIPTPISTKNLHKTITEYRKSKPESSGLAPPPQWINALSPSYLSPNLYPPEKLQVKVPQMSTASHQDNNGQQDDDSDSEHYWDMDSDEEDEEIYDSTGSSNINNNKTNGTDLSTNVARAGGAKSIFKD